MNNSCQVCNSGNLTVHIPARDLNTNRDILKCGNCGLAFFANHREEKLDASYWDSQEHMHLYEEANIQAGFKQEFKNRLKQIKNIKPRGRLLDIGCGLGDFLCVARENGWQVCGVEISPAAAKYAQEKRGLDVYAGTVENCAFENESVDVITMWDVLEHIQNPLEALGAITDKLRGEGLLVIKTPDEKSLFKMISRIFYRVSAKKLNFLLKYVYYLPHYFYYNEKTLRKLLEKFDFKVIRIERESTDYNFAKEKIKLHYKKFLSKKLILAGLPLVYFFSKFFRMQNKIIVYAVKK